MANAKTGGPAVSGPAISVLSQAGRIEIRLGGEVIADSRQALALKEGAYQIVLYIPRSDVRMDLARRSDHTTTCPHKGVATYYSFSAGGQTVENAAWSYETPHAELAMIAGCLAFYPNRVDEIAITG